MLSDETLKALIEAIIYVAPEPVSLDAIVKTLEGEERDRIRAKLEELLADYEQPQRGIQIRPVAGGYKFSSKAEHHEVLRKYVKSLKPPLRLSKPALETLAVIAYRQPVTVPEINEIRGVDCGGVIHTLMEKKLIVTSGRKNVVGRPILYRTSRDFLVHFGLKDVGELPSLKEFEELARQAMGPEWAAEAATAAVGGTDAAPAMAPSGEAGAEPAPGVEVAAESAAENPEAVPVAEPAPAAAEATRQPAPGEETVSEPIVESPESATVEQAASKLEEDSLEPAPAEEVTPDKAADNPEEA